MRPGSWGCPWRPSTWRSRASSRASVRRWKGSSTDGCRPRVNRARRSCKVLRPFNSDRLVMTEDPLNHPGEEALRALSLGQLAEAELARVSAHLGECPACCRRLDQLATDDRLLAQLQQGSSKAMAPQLAANAMARQRF